MQVSVAHQFLPKQNSTRASLVMDHFGIDFEQGQHVIADQLQVPCEAGDIVLFTGESGSGKSSLMQGVRGQLQSEQQNVVALSQLDLGERILVDALDLPLDETLKLLTACGLGEAQLLLRTPQELSDGQRYRFSLALALSKRPDWVLADEYTATLDRDLAKIISFNIRKVADRTQTGFLLATTHNDIVDDLAPDTHVQCQLDGQIQVTANSRADRKKKVSRWQIDSGSPPPPKPTGRISLGGITAATTSG